MKFLSVVLIIILGVFAILYTNAFFSALWMVVKITLGFMLISFIIFLLAYLYYKHFK